LRCDPDEMHVCVQVNARVVPTRRRRRRTPWTVVWSAGPSLKTTQTAKIRRRKEKTRAPFVGVYI